MIAPPPRAVRPATALPHGLIAVAPETRTALAATASFARGRFVDLQMAVEPQDLILEADAAEYQACLRALILDAVGRASSGVLVTATRQAHGVEIAVLDDGTGASRDVTSAAGKAAALLGATLRVEHHPHRGTSLLLWLPQPDSVPFRATAIGGTDADADL